MSPAPFFSEVADGPAGGHAVWLTAADGVRIRIGLWPKGRKGTVIVLPGRTECVEKYGRAANDLAKHGYAVVAIDWRGQGLADRALPDRHCGHVGHFDEYQLDLDAVLAEVDRIGLPEPRHMLAHSMGGCIGLRALIRGSGFNSALFSAPMWGISMAAWLRPMAQMVSGLSGLFGQGHRYAPGTGPGAYVEDAPFLGNVLTTDADMWEYMKRQLVAHPDLSLGGPSLTWLRAALSECDLLAVLPAPDLPAVCGLGLAEKVVDVPPVHLRMAGWSKGRLDLYPMVEHEIMMETAAVRQKFFDSAAVLFDANR